MFKRRWEKKLKKDRKEQQFAIRRQVLERDLLYRYVSRSAYDEFQIVNALEQIGKKSVDVVIAHELSKSGLLGLRIASKFASRIRIVDNVEYPDLAGRSSTYFRDLAAQDSVGNELLSSLQTKVANSFDCILATSKGQMDALDDLGVRTRKVLLRNMRYSQKVERDYSIRQDCSCGGEDILLLYCNNVYPSTGAEEVIAALAVLPRSYRLAFLGEIRVDREMLDQLVTKNGVEGRVTFLDPVPPGKLVSYSSGADLALIPLLPSTDNHVHCLPNRVFESIAASNPIVAPAMIETGAFVEEHGIGTVFGSFASEAIAEAILSASARLAEGGFEKAMARAASDMVWENERNPFLQLIGCGEGQSALLITRKGIERNDRIHRLTSELVSHGYSTTVIAMEQPMNELKVPEAEYLTIGNN